MNHVDSHDRHDTLADGAGCGDGILMIEPRKKLSLRLQSPEPRDEASTVAVLTQALTRRSCVTWTYNRTAMRASPQISTGETMRFIVMRS